MLQGPLGPFFTRIAADLVQDGAEVYKVNFNGGDWLFSVRGPWREEFNFTGSIAEWPEVFADLLTHLRIDAVFLFGDCRPIHVPAIAVARHRNIDVGVFEEGYLRPDYITLERGGVNNRSSLPGDPEFYLAQTLSPARETSPVGSTFGKALLWGVLYYTAATLGKPVFKHYWHHRPIGMLEGVYWIRSFARKVLYKCKEKSLQSRLLGPAPDRFFLVPLQTCGDAQIKIHSRFRTIPRFIEHVVRSFARSAPSDCMLAIKHHPLDRGYTDYSALIDRLVRKYQLQSRCHYIHDQHLPTLLRNTQGVVVVNSTVGLSAVGEGVPVKVCGEAIYNMPGLTYQDDLDRFWTDTSAFRPDPRLWSSFRNYLIARTQYNGSFYRRLRSTGFCSGVAWASPPLDSPTMPLAEIAIPGTATSQVLAIHHEAAVAKSDRPSRHTTNLPLEEMASAG